MGLGLRARLKHEVCMALGQDDGPFSPDLPPVHVAADHEVGRAVPDVDTGEVSKCVAQLREAAFCFQAVHQDLRGKKAQGVSPIQSGDIIYFPCATLEEKCASLCPHKTFCCPMAWALAGH